MDAQKKKFIIRNQPGKISSSTNNYEKQDSGRNIYNMK